MPSLQQYLVGPYETGEQNNIEPWLLPEDAFRQLEDAYVWRGRVRKRFGYELLGGLDLKSRLRVRVGITNGSGNLSDNVPGTKFKIGQMFSIGTEIFTVNKLNSVGPPAPSVMLDTGSATKATYDTDNGDFVFEGADPNTVVFFFPADPVMGLRTRERGDINFEDTLAFDTQFSYQRVGDAWEKIVSAVLGTDIWTGTDSQFFWSTNYTGNAPEDTSFYTVNFNRADHIRILPQGSTDWFDLRAQTNLLDDPDTNFLDSCRILIGYKDRLLALNTLETQGSSELSFPWRCRFSQEGDPTDPLTSWVDAPAGKGGFVDAPTRQQIVTADIIKDRLIVYFERSTWELVDLGLSSTPFKWQQVNNELGCESTFSVIGFDDSILGVGNVGIHDCNGINVRRIDQKIPDEVFKIHNQNKGPERVYGIRDFAPELVYWTFPPETQEPTFPTRILVYNYQNKSWAFFNDSFTCFGYFQKNSDLTWKNVGQTYPTWSSWDAPWNSGRFQSAFPAVGAGNQQGFTFIIDTDNNTNSQSLQITDMIPPDILKITDHNLSFVDFIRLEEFQGTIDLDEGVIVKVKKVEDTNTITIDTNFTGVYTGGGKARRISNFNILTKQYNPGTPVGIQFRFPYIDFLLDITTKGQLTVNYLIDASKGTNVTDNTPPGTLLGNNILFTKFEQLFGDQKNSIYTWHRFYVQAAGQFIQLQLTMSEEQIKDFEISASGFAMQAMLLNVEREGRLLN